MKWLPRATQRESGQSQGSNTEANAVSPTCPSLSSLFVPSLPPLYLPSRGLCRAGEAAAWPLTSLLLSAPPQKSCTCHPGPPACPAASARSTPWLSCAPISGQGPMPTPVASRSSPSASQQRAPLQLHQSQAGWGNSPGWADIGTAPFRKPPGANLPHSAPRGPTRAKTRNPIPSV